MKRTVTLALAVLIVATVAAAQLSQQFKDWPNGPAGYLMTKADRKAFEALKSDAEAQTFIDLFWAKRNPNPDSVVNPFKLDFDAKVAAADKQFSTDKIKGSMTDRGRVLIVLGRPAGGREFAPGTQVSRIGETIEGGVFQWVYKRDMLPETLRGLTKAEEIFAFFVESRSGAKDFSLDRGDPRNAQIQKLIAEAPERYVVSPKMTEVPRLGLLPGSKALNSAQRTVLAAQPRPWPEGAVATWVDGMQSSTIKTLWVHVQLPDGVPAAAQALGMLSSGTGEEKGSFAVAVTPLSVAGARAYEFAVPLEGGDWKLDVALLDATSNPVGITTVAAKVDPIPPDGTYLSPFYYGVDIRQEPKAFPGPFNVGGWHVLPRIGDTYTTSETISYFCYVVRPSRDEQGKAKPMLFSAAVFQGQKRLTPNAPPDPVDLSNIPGDPDLWMFGNALPLNIFRTAGEYRLELTLKDATTNASRVVSIPIKLTLAQGAAPAPAQPPAAQPAPAKP